MSVRRITDNSSGYRCNQKQDITATGLSHSRFLANGEVLRTLYYIAPLTLFALLPTGVTRETQGWRMVLQITESASINIFPLIDLLPLPTLRPKHWLSVQSLDTQRCTPATVHAHRGLEFLGLAGIDVHPIAMQ